MTDDELRLNIRSLHASIHELFEAVQRHDVQLALARIAEIHERRLSHLEGDNPQ